MAPPSTYRIGISIGDDVRSYQPGAFEAMRMGVTRNVQGAGLIFQTLWGLFTRETSPKQLMGPVAIAQLSGESAQLGWIALDGGQVHEILESQHAETAGSLKQAVQRAGGQ